MAQVTPASIAYTPTKGPEEVIDFHAVIFEEHLTEAEITAYPVQEGFHVSNHSIRKNRTISISGLISNILLEGSKSGSIDYGSKATSTVKAVFDALINTGVECRVVTNLGYYSPVVFKRFKTKQKEGLVDSMSFTVTGEEIIKVDVDNNAAATELSFTEVPSLNRDTIVAELATAEIHVKDCDQLLQSSFTVGEDFVINSTNSAGEPVATTYEFIGLDPSTGQPRYEIHVSESCVAVYEDTVANTAKSDVCAEEGFESSLTGGVEQIAACLINEVIDTGIELVEDTIATALGSLKKSLRGFIYDTTTMSNEYGQAMFAAGVGCIIRGSIGTPSDTTYVPGESLPTTDQIMTGLGEGLGFTEPEPDVVTLTQIICACTGDVPDAIDFDLIPQQLFDDLDIL